MESQLAVLNQEEISDRILDGEIIKCSDISKLEDQIQPNGLDVTLDKLEKIKNNKMRRLLEFLPTSIVDAAMKKALK